jgi:gliding motility-associated protein GldL
MGSKINIITRLQHWMDSVPGQTFLNYAYSWGASIVILGALFKLTHLPGGNIMLFLGMGTEAIVFFLAAFDRPFDKNEIGKALPNDFETDEEIETAEGLTDEAHETIVREQQQLEQAAAAVGAGPAAYGYGGGGTIVIGGAQIATSATGGAEAQDMQRKAELAAQHPVVQQAVKESTSEEEAEKLAAIIRMANDELLHRAQAVLSPDMEEATQVYIEKLRVLTETFAKVDEQTARLTKDSQEMENLNRTLIGINKIYDLHFASISKQVNTIEEINEQTRGLAAKIQEVNDVYAQMIKKLTAISNPIANN